MAATSVEIASPESGPNPPPAEVKREPWQPEGFTGTQENLAKSWTDQRAELTRLQQQLKEKGVEPNKADPNPQEQKSQEPTPEQKPEGQQQQEPQKKTEDEAAKEVIEKAGIDIAPFQAEFDQTGDVTEDNRAQIAEKLKPMLGDLARQAVDQFIEGRKTVVANDTQLYMAEAGGEDAYNAMRVWAAANMPKEEIAALNRQFDSNDRHSILFGIETLRSRYEAANGRIPNLVRGRAPAAGSNSQPFNSSAEMTRAMRDPRYKTDPSYRDEIKQRISASKNI